MASTTPVVACQRIFVGCPANQAQKPETSMPTVTRASSRSDWSLFEKEDLVDLDDDLRAAFRERAIPTPAHVASDRQRLSDERRYDVPATVIACEFSSAQVREWMAQDHPAMRELARIRDVGYIDLPTGHWPQFAKPAELGQAIVASVAPPGK